MLQDLPPIIDDIKELHPDIVKVKYDFSTSQPIKGKATGSLDLYLDTNQMRAPERIISAPSATTGQTAGAASF